MKTLLLPLVWLLSGVGMLVVGSGLLFAVIGLQSLAADLPLLATGRPVAHVNDLVQRERVL